MSKKLLIVILYHLEGFKNFRYYYKYAVEIKYKSLFKEVPCYNRFIQIMTNLLLPLSILLQFLFGEVRGIYFLDTTKVSICHSMRKKQSITKEISTGKKDSELSVNKSLLILTK